MSVDGARLRFRDEGTGPAVLLIHGWALDLDMWEPQANVLSSRHRVIRFDRRGFGASTGEPSVAHDVRDIQAVLQRLRVQRAALVGMSQGARAALRVALAAPQYVSCLVLDGPPDETERSPSATPVDVPLEQYRKLAEEKGMDAVRSHWSRHPFMQLTTRDAQVHALLKQITDRYPGRDLFTANVTVSASLAERLREITVPTLIINGERDSVERRAAGAALASLIPGARSALIPNAGHLANLDNPDFYTSTLTRFFMERCGCKPSI